jgi:hypothetical protein
MFSKEIVPLLVEVIQSWQVIAVSIAVILYISLVSYVARTYHRPRTSKSRPRKKQKAAAVAASGPEEVVAPAGADTNAELGLEEAEA